MDLASGFGRSLFDAKNAVATGQWCFDRDRVRVRSFGKSEDFGLDGNVVSSGGTDRPEQYGKRELNENNNRRPLKTRSTAWARALAAGLIRFGISPNAISIASIVASVLGAYALLCAPPPWGYVLCALCVQLRLLCNLLDGMVAIEGGRKSAYGALYNELPDRIADSLFIVCLGYAIGEPALGWFGALAAALTAYIRAIGGALGFAQDFRGPLAKQHRMAVLTIGLLLTAVEYGWRASTHVLWLTAWVIAIGSAVTCATRTHAIAKQLKAAA